MNEPVFENIEQIIPHRSPMVMIQGYRKIDENKAASFIQYDPKNYACHGGQAAEIMLIESVAQTVAAHFGYKAMVEKDPLVAPGMLTSVDEFTWYETVSDKARIDIRIEKTDEIGAFKLISGEVKIKERLIAKGRIKIFNPPAEEFPK